MKKIFKLIGIVALTAVIGFSMTACGDGGGGGGKGTLTINVRNDHPSKTINNIKVYDYPNMANIGAVLYDSGTISLSNGQTHGPFTITGLQTGALGHTSIRVRVWTGSDPDEECWENDNPESGGTYTYYLNSSGYMDKE